MDYKNFVLEYYKNAVDGIHIHQVHNSSEASKLHSHEYFQIYYIKKGTLMHYINDNEAKLVVGDMFIVPPGIKHRISEDIDTVFYSLSFLPDTLDYMAKDSFSVSFLKTLKKETGVRLKISLPSDEVLRVETIIKEIYREFETQNIGSREILKSYILILISIFARRYYEDMSAVIPAQDIKRFILHCIEYIKEHYYQEIKLDEIAHLSAMSKTRFCSEFKMATGIPFNQYLNTCRIQKAKEYMQKGYKITAIYGLVGYRDFSTFYRNFKKITGISPKEYEKSTNTRVS